MARLAVDTHIQEMDDESKIRALLNLAYRRPRAMDAYKKAIDEQS